MIFILTACIYSWELVFWGLLKHPEGSLYPISQCPVPISAASFLVLLMHTLELSCNVPSTWVPAIHVADLDGILSFHLSLAQARLTCYDFGHELENSRSFYLSNKIQISIYIFWKVSFFFHFIFHNYVEIPSCWWVEGYECYKILTLCHMRKDMII